MKIEVIFSVCAAAIVLAKDQFDPSSYAHGDVLSRDIAIIGGGSSGIYSAMNLKAEGKSVVVVEKDEELGGHTRTWVDPNTGVIVNWGLQAYYNNSAAIDYFSLLGIDVGQLSFSPLNVVYSDLQTGTPVNVQTSGNYDGYEEQLSKYPYLSYGWDLPSPVPSDLLLSFDDFIQKYDIADEVYNIFSAGRGFTNILNQLTINVMKMVDYSYFNSMAGAAIGPVSGKNDEIYSVALRRLGSDALLSSSVTAAERPDNPNKRVHLVVKTPLGNKLIQAKKLLITAPPLVDNLKPFSLDTKETGLFSKWTYSNYFIMLLKNTGLPAGYEYLNANASSSTFNTPQLPAPYLITATKDPNIFYSWYASPYDMTQAEVEADVTNIIRRLRKTTNSTVTTAPEIFKFHSHTPFKLVADADAITGGFYEKLKQLQGHRNTWYTGAAFISHDSSVLWNYTRYEVLPLLS
ncbi:hypothetical protein N7462_000629 [Penicillium macrosclerotiorum]|uniref:uncharacterized protein n=1 Tax=Penicillium macrosclerotiorum TaxID=303699 RepID=UPI002547C4FC|nr:uncharacterized protein N7462_000629 [Penicillium macrosclerotiorum]KAJ5698624.1 hypothetical protein N7462_000629 [Penicillium macrosclerotiorum]